MAISVPVPKDLSGIKTKVALNLTKRQIICFSGAAIVGVPLYFLTKNVIGTQGAAFIMVGVMLPFFFLAMYTKDGFPAEKILYFIQQNPTQTAKKTQGSNIYEHKFTESEAEKDCRSRPRKCLHRFIARLLQHFLQQLIDITIIFYN